MNEKISIISKTVTTDDEGFQTFTDTTLWECRAYREGRHGSNAWMNRASFTDATDLFVIRKPHDVEIKDSYYLICDGDTYDITSIENVKGRGMYLSILGKMVKPSGQD